MGIALPKDVKKGSGFKGSKVKRLDNSRIRSDVMSKTDFDELPSACSGPEPVEGSRVEFGLRIETGSNLRFNGRK